MKTNPSHFILVAEIIIIILFHTVKIRQSEKHPAETAFAHINQKVSPHKTVTENKSGFEYMLVNLVK
jgi:hypothetical protein